MSIQEFHINELVNHVCQSNAKIGNILCDLNLDEQIAMCAILTNGRYDIKKLPIIADNDVASNIKVEYFNQLKGKIQIRFTSLKEKKYLSGQWAIDGREVPLTRYTTISFERYMEYANGMREFDEYQ